MPTAPPQLQDPGAAVSDAEIRPTPKERILKGVGGFIAGGSGASSSGIDAEIEKHHASRLNEARMHRQNASTYAGILATGIDPATGQKLTPEEEKKYQDWYNASWTAYEKAAGVSKETKGALGKAKSVVEHIIGAGKKAREGQTDAGRGGGGLTPPPSPLGGGGATATEGENGGASAARMTPPPQYNQQTAMGGGALHEQVQDTRDFNLWKKQQELLRDFKIQETEAAAKAKAASPSTRAVMGPAISVRNARSLAMQGKSFNDIDGNPIDLTALPDSMGLKNVIHGGKSYFEPFSPNSKVITVGNETYAVSPMDVEALVPKEKEAEAPSPKEPGKKPAGTDLGVHRTGTASTSKKGIDPNTGVDVTERSSTPMTPGRRTTPPPAVEDGTKPAQGAGAAQGAGTAKKGDLLPTNQTAKRVAPVREAMTQLFGDPSQPDFKSLSDYASMADDPKKSANVAKAVQLTLQKLGESEKKAGSMLTLLQNYGGVPQALMQSQVDLMKDVVGKLSPKESELYNTIISSISTVMGLRSLTSASAAKFSVEALERDIPIPGFNVFSKKAFNNKMAKLAENVYSGSRTVPLDPKERKFIEEQVKRFSDGESKSRTTPPPKPGDTTHPLDEEIMEAVKKAKKKAA